MTSAIRINKWSGRTIGGLPAGDVAVTVFLCAATFFIVLKATWGKLPHTHHAGAAAAVGALAMVIPVVWRRRSPPAALAAAGVLAAAAVINGFGFGHAVRCGVTLPALFLVAYAFGAYGDTNSRAVCLGFAFGAVSAAAQGVFDPRLGLAMIPVLIVLFAGFFAVGRVVRSRTQASDTLKEQSAALRRRREETARMTVLADRARISDDLSESIDDRMAHISQLAAAGQDALASDPAAAGDTLATIEGDSREVLQDMRRIVGALDSAPPHTPEPTLAELPALLVRATTADATLTIEGDRRRLPAGMELTTYRIVEHLLSALVDSPGAKVRVILRFQDDSIEVQVSGPAAEDVEFGAVLAAARERAALYRGTLEGETAGPIRQATARLPLVSGHA